MQDELRVPPNWRRDDPDFSEDVARKYDPHAVVEYEHRDLNVWLVLAPGRVPPRIADDERGYRIELRHGEERTRRPTTSRSSRRSARPTTSPRT
ncbi:hypothetical protein [Halospeciosus flavus]|uniref:hypothetical protein n=1 Tax=Halospeciosus flavus TaxID=3032283 RepID=UPI00361F8D58